MGDDVIFNFFLQFACTYERCIYRTCTYVHMLFNIYNIEDRPILTVHDQCHSVLHGISFLQIAFVAHTYSMRKPIPCVYVITTVAAALFV